MLAGGAGTVFDESPQAFSLALRNLSTTNRRGFAVGNAFFNDNWVTAPASAEGRDGLGPLFNAKSCSSCHLRDGRGRPPEAHENMLSMLVRISIPGQDEYGAPVPDPNYGLQIQNQAVGGVPVEARPEITWETIEGAYGDGTPYTLRRPILELSDQAYGNLHSEHMTSIRVAQSVFGLGLIEAVPESTIESLADPDDKDGDGISGRTNRVWSASLERQTMGRFGWKANTASLRDQTAEAFLGDIGITSTLHLAENHTEIQTEAAQALNGGQPELDDHKLNRITLYLQSLAVPARRNAEDIRVQRGEQAFLNARCDTCHQPRLQTGASHAIPALHNQEIHPYSNFLLHDLGPGLADDRPDFQASGSEWRTPPLWGLGLQKVVNGHELFLHDGRARGVAEAILWHGGEAEEAKESFRSMTADEREDLIAFIHSL